MTDHEPPLAAAQIVERLRELHEEAASENEEWLVPGSGAALLSAWEAKLARDVVDGAFNPRNRTESSIAKEQRSFAVLHAAETKALADVMKLWEGEED